MASGIRGVMIPGLGGSSWGGLILNLLGLVFVAGGTWALGRYKIQRLERNLNGIGTKLNQAIEQGNNRYQRAVLAIMLFVPEENKPAVAGILKEERK